MTTDSTCPDCGRPLAKDCHPALEGCKKRFPGYASKCDQLTIARLRAELAAEKAQQLRDRDAPGWQDTEETPNPYTDHTEKSDG